MPEKAKQKKEKKQERVVVEIFGQDYALRTDEPEYLRQLATVVDKQMKQTARKAHTFDATKIAVLGALQIADEYCKLRKDYDELVELLDEK
ncbi:MAG: cell division protein ZapA [Selenomonadaceae bacterium]|jgi:cell division protein ZapA|nr:cell division protein ZapA [Selenomonadaceae bacterium]MDD6119363.1 cell division protein ZapA [Selenomonadaceae bacterium]MDD7055609.1 cell division protein ZapA [Selenomonadaceae bacterium]MDY3917344.1 cell division protein ZapA [Selenomonadaceae bacterium]